ncbi:ABC transporter permease [Fredinandcohnia quinoae]|uniref:ABC transporter permease n=1 Tax=Fredinandcohnia quinoae TaxID=2918902 RepID=A0AAW5EA09_9BACI|nr:ABC transporter permease [Fredinandcohnia sp. SECRCQ15]MCH1627844.1 ABC transporter permease [Fredinandcohnia sp. SECRCQ15]
MRHFTKLIAFQLKMIMKSWKTAITLLVVPMVFLAGIGLVCIHLLTTEERVQLFDIAIVDNDDTFETKYVIQQLVQSEHLTKLTNVIKTDETRANNLMDNNEIAAMIIIPEGFSSNVKIGENTPVKVFGNAQKPLQSQLVRHIMESAADFTSAAQSGINTIYEFTSIDPFTKKERKTEFKQSLLTYSLHVLGRGEPFQIIEKHNLFQTDIVQYYTLSLFLLLIMFWSYGFLLLVKGKTTQTLRFRLLSRGITDSQMTASTLPSLIVVLAPITYAIAIPMSYWLTGNLFDIRMLAGILLILVTFLTFFIMLESLFHHQQIYQIVGLVFILFGAIAGGFFIPTVFFPDWLEKVGSYTIQSWSFSFLLEVNSLTANRLVLASIVFLLLAFLGQRRWSR